MNRNATAVILIILAIGIYFTVTQSAWNDAKLVKGVNDQYVSAIANAQQLVSVRDKVLQAYNNVSQSDRDRLEKMLPSTVDNIRLIIDLNNVAVQHGLSLKGIHATVNSPSQPGSTGSGPTVASNSTGIAVPQLATVNVGFAVSAPYQQFISFLQDLEADLRIMDVKSLTISAGDNGQYNFNLELTTYWLHQ